MEEVARRGRDRGPGVLTAAPLRVAFWGSPAFAVATLEALLASRHAVVAVVTRPERPRGRGRKPAPTPVERAARAAGIPVLAPAKARDPAFLDALRAFAPDVSVVAAYGAILPAAALDLPRFGSLNVHASLLPEYRGAAPVTRAILDGRAATGVTIMRMDAGLDTGAIALQAEEPIGPDDSAGDVTERLARLGAALAVEALDRLAEGTLPDVPQDGARATYAAKVDTAEAELDWSRPAAELDRVARAYDPWPGAWTERGSERLKVARLAPAAAPTDAAGPAPGTVLALDPLVATGDGAARLLVVQPAGGRRMDAAAWARGARLQVGERLGRLR